jgi:hypothetical protein
MATLFDMLTSSSFLELAGPRVIQYCLYKFEGMLYDHREVKNANTPWSEDVFISS